MNLMKFAVGLAVIASAAHASNAHAQSASTTFDVTITITSTCSIDTPAATDVAFGTQPSTATAIEATGQLNVNCTPGTDYDIALDAGLNDGGAGIGARAMSSGADLVPYQLYQDPARTAVWGETIGTDTLAGTGTGAVQPIQVYGLTPSANFPAASYIDTVTATITY
ncbi:MULTISPECIES: Csu type fimbrial protein [unclassified Luteimonas]